MSKEPNLCPLCGKELRFSFHPRGEYCPVCEVLYVTTEVTVTANDLETKYVSRASYNALAYSNDELLRRLEAEEKRSAKAEAALSKEKESMVQKAMELLSSCSCDKHTAVSFSEFYDAEKAAGCAQCQKERAERAEADAERLRLIGNMIARDFEVLIIHGEANGLDRTTERQHLQKWREVSAHDAGKDGGG